MPNHVTESFRTSADYMYVDAALKSLWQPFNELVKEMDSFVPHPLADFEGKRLVMLEQFRQRNTLLSDETIEKFVNDSIALEASERVQFSERFSSRFMSLYVMVAVLSHALCEAAINAILAMGLTQTGTHALFSVLEKAEIKEKWRVGPKSFFPNYELNPGSAVFETLNHLTKRRNALIHNKIHVHVGDQTILEGSNFERLSFQVDARWMRRFFSLPYDLSAQAYAQWQFNGFSIFVLPDRSPIAKADAH